MPLAVIRLFSISTDILSENSEIAEGIYFSTTLCYDVVFLMFLQSQRKSVESVRFFYLLRLVSFLVFTEKAFLFLLGVQLLNSSFQFQLSVNFSHLKQGAYDRLITVEYKNMLPVFVVF
jgi:hypothetical protein